MTGTGPLIRPLTPADRSALAEFGLTPTARERRRNGDVVVLINVADLLGMLE